MGLDPASKKHRNVNSFKQFIEELAELEHNQWLHYSKAVSQQIMDAKSLASLKEHIKEEWAPDWKPYALLSDEEKEKDRTWAYKVLEVMRSNPIELKSILSKSPITY